MKPILLFFIVLTVGLLFVSCTTIERPLTSKQTPYYQIINVNVIDVINETIKYNHDVVVENGIIVSIEPNAQPKATNLIKGESRDNLTGNIPTVIEGEGRFLIPGLWDNHSTLLKISPEVDFPLYIANGVTSIRSNLSCPNEDKMSLYACMKDKADWNKAIKLNNMLGPTIQGWGTFPITGTSKKHPDSPSFHSATTVIDAHKVVKHYAAYQEEQRPFFLKTYNWIKPEQFSELSFYAKQYGFELSGHMQRSIPLIDVIDSGQRSIAHARLFMFDCSTLSAELRAGKYKKTPLPELYRILINTFDEKDCDIKYKYLAKRDVFLNPTLMTRRNDYYVVANKLNEIQGLDYAHYLFMMEFEEDSEKLSKHLSIEDVNVFKDFYLLSARSIAQAQKAGVKILAGTDSWNEYVIPGFSLHEELLALHEAGVDNYGILQAATINGAKYFRIEDEVGSVDVGKQANMVLLDANPIKDIKNTQAIYTVFKGQQIYKAPKLKQLKGDVKKLSNSHLLTAKILLMLLQNPTGF